MKEEIENKEQEKLEGRERGGTRETRGGEREYEKLGVRETMRS